MSAAAPSPTSKISARDVSIRKTSQKTQKGRRLLRKIAEVISL